MKQFIKSHSDPRRNRKERFWMTFAKREPVSMVSRYKANEARKKISV